MWLAGGLVAVGLGALGVIVPGLPSTGFFILAAWCFSKSSPRLEQWVLNLRGIGPMVQNYRAGLGMRRRAKTFAIGSMALTGSLSIVFALDSLASRLVVGIAVLIGIWFVGFHVPTTETVLQERTTGP